MGYKEWKETVVIATRGTFRKYIIPFYFFLAASVSIWVLTMSPQRNAFLQGYLYTILHEKFLNITIPAWMIKTIIALIILSATFKTKGETTFRRIMIFTFWMAFFLFGSFFIFWLLVSYHG